MPVAGGVGCISAGIGTSITFDGAPGVVTPAEHGTVNDLAPFSGNAGFITFPGVTFDLAMVGPGVANTVCANTFNPSDPACAAVTGSPFVLTPGSTGVNIAFAVRGMANDATSSTSPWQGVFTTQLVGKTPFDIQQIILNPSLGSVTATYSFDGEATAPEPASMLLIGAGLLGLATLTRRRKARA
jgi:hypothetical protein